MRHGRRGQAARHGERGSVTVIGAAILAMTAMLGVTLAEAASVAAARARVQATADAAALAAAQELIRGDATPAAVARAYAARNGARLVACACEPGGLEATVTMEATAPAGLAWRARRVRASARAVVGLGEAGAGLDAAFAARLGCLLARVPRVEIGSGLRTRAEQARLHRERPDLAAPPGRSPHERGLAADLVFADVRARALAHLVAPACGLRFPVPGEPWHVEAAVSG